MVWEAKVILWFYIFVLIFNRQENPTKSTKFEPYKYKQLASYTVIGFPCQLFRSYSVATGSYSSLAAPQRLVRNLANSYGKVIKPISWPLFLTSVNIMNLCILSTCSDHATSVHVAM